jgi:hypothetical protein
MTSMWRAKHGRAGDDPLPDLGLSLAMISSTSRAFPPWLVARLMARVVVQ